MCLENLDRLKGGNLYAAGWSWWFQPHDTRFLWMHYGSDMMLEVDLAGYKSNVVFLCLSFILVEDEDEERSRELFKLLKVAASAIR